MTIIPVQTAEVLSGVGIVALYFLVVMILGMGVCRLQVMLPMRKEGSGVFETIEFGWFSFVVGQGILGLVWLVVALTGKFYPSVVWTISLLALAWGLFVLRKKMAQKAFAVFQCFRRDLFSAFKGSWYRWLSGLILGVVVMKGMSALAPTDIDDALMWYLVSPLSIAASHVLALQPYLSPHNGLYPLQVEMHWAALFEMGNETAVLVWDYLCAVSVLVGLGGLAWKVSGQARVGLVAVLLLLSTEGFFHVMGGGKADISGAQYGVAAVWSLLLFPRIGRLAFILGGAFLGWSIASRYTNIILAPAMYFGVFGVIKSNESFSLSIRQWMVRWSEIIQPVFILGLAALVTTVPMLVKNWFLVGCPFAPLVGCRGTFWAESFHVSSLGRANLSSLDLLLYPFIWTFGERPDMLGGISPLYLGLVPLLLLPSIRKALTSHVSLMGVMAVISFVTWMLIGPRILFTRFLLLPLVLMAVPLATAFVETVRNVHGSRWVPVVMKSSLVIMCAWLVFDARSMVYGLRYVANADGRESRYAGKIGYDEAQWLNNHVNNGDRIGIAGWEGSRLFLRVEHLLNSESADERQVLWDLRVQVQEPRDIVLTAPAWTADILRFYRKRRFSYVIIPNGQVEVLKGIWKEVRPSDPFLMVFVGKRHTIVKILEDEKCRG